MDDVGQWTVAELIQRLPVHYWFMIAAGIAAIFGAGFGLSRWVQSRKLENAEADLAAERAKPKTTITVGSGDKDVGDIAHMLRFSFSKPEFIHPAIVEELEGWISDGLPVYAAVDLEGAMASNRFFLPPAKKPKPTADGWVYVEKETEHRGFRNPFYGYKFIGVTPSGTHLIQTASCGGGTGIFCNILFMRFQTDDVLTSTLGEITTRRRIVLRCVGGCPLGDRYEGEVSYADGVLTIGAGSHIDIGRTPVQEMKIRVD